MENKLTWMIGGKAGYGIMSTGLIFSKACARGGLHVFDTVEYPSLIRGGHNSYHVRVEDEEVHSNIGIIDILVALNTDTVQRHKDSITESGAIIFDSSETKVENQRGDIKLIDVPLIALAKEQGDKVMMNSVASGASLALVDYDFGILEQVIKDVFNDKGKGIVGKNIAAAKAGYDYIKNKNNDVFKAKLKKIGGPKLLLTGNEAIAIGAIKAGCKLYAAYPMTPASSILHYMAAHEKSKNIVVKQTEDEICAIHTVIGASFAGVRAMTATSGGGFCLMSEGLGLAALSETPIVIALCQRAGPSTGLATRTEQADLRFIMHASQGEFPRIIFTPGDIDECFSLTELAFNLADKYQLPVFVVSDKHLSESHKTAEKLNNDFKINSGWFVANDELDNDKFKRYQITETGISPRTIPGQEHGIFRSNSYEHDEFGWNNEEIENRIVMMDKRFNKLKNMSDLPHPNVYDSKNSEITIISWGSTKGACLEALKWLKKDGIDIKYIHMNMILPFNSEFIKDVIKSSKMTIVIEQNHDMQLAGIIKQYTGMDVYKIAKYDGRQILPSEICAKIKEMKNEA
jgi:2-oxoglutarate ferredoxin oxidoreductase subunit alpha